MLRFAAQLPGRQRTAYVTTYLPCIQLSTHGKHGSTTMNQVLSFQGGDLFAEGIE